MRLPIAIAAASLVVGLLAPCAAIADGKVFVPREYAGSVEERSQEAIIVFRKGTRGDDGRPVGEGAHQDLILKITVEGDRAGGGDLTSLGWVVPFPRVPTVEKEDAKLFKECFDYVESRRARRYASKGKKGETDGQAAKSAEGVEVISRRVVGSYDVAVVREKKAGALDEWLAKEGFQTVGAESARGGEEGDPLAFYREKGYVFACMKVSEAALKPGARVDLHPLRFSFRTGGVDGIYFPMRLTGLQKRKFDVNLYVFYDKWVNDSLSPYGYVHRGFRLVHRDWDTSECEANAGKLWSSPQNDPYLAPYARKVPTLKKYFQRRHPGRRFYLTNIRAWSLDPQDVRRWKDDLWMFPYYTNRDFVPFDARPGGPASAAYVD